MCVGQAEVRLPPYDREDFQNFRISLRKVKSIELKLWLCELMKPAFQGTDLAHSYWGSVRSREDEKLGRQNRVDDRVVGE